MIQGPSPTQHPFPLMGSLLRGAGAGTGSPAPGSTGVGPSSLAQKALLREQKAGALPECGAWEPRPPSRPEEAPRKDHSRDSGLDGVHLNFPRLEEQANVDKFPVVLITSKKYRCHSFLIAGELSFGETLKQCLYIHIREVICSVQPALVYRGQSVPGSNT